MSKLTIVTSLFSGAGGTERAVINLANMLSSTCKVRIISVFTTKEEKEQFYISPDVEVVHLGLKNRFYPSKIWKLFWKLIKYIKNEDFVIGQAPFVNILLCVYRFLGIVDCKVLLTEHTSYFAVNKISRFFSLIFYRYADKVVTLTYDSAKHFIKKGISNICVIPNAVYFKTTKVSSCCSKNILAVGRLSSEKNFLYLIDTLEATLKKHTDWKLIIVGEGEEYNNIEHKIEICHLEKSVFLESFTKNIIEKYLSASIYVLTSKYEGFPLVILEAKTMGLPVVAHDCPTGPKEIIKQNDGILTPYMDPIAFSQAVEELIVDKERRKTYGKNAVINVQEFSQEVIKNKWNEIFEDFK